LKCYANRAACYKQLSNFESTISDSTMVLEHKPDDIKVAHALCCSFLPSLTLFAVADEKSPSK
jgi:hypothetical protein